MSSSDEDDTLGRALKKSIDRRVERGVERAVVAYFNELKSLPGGPAVLSEVCTFMNRAKKCLRCDTRVVLPSPSMDDARCGRCAPKCNKCGKPVFNDDYGAACDFCDRGVTCFTCMPVSVVRVECQKHLRALEGESRERLTLRKVHMCKKNHLCATVWDFLQEFGLWHEDGIKDATLCWHGRKLTEESEDNVRHIDFAEARSLRRLGASGTREWATREPAPPPPP